MGLNATNFINIATGFQKGYQITIPAKAEKIVTQGQNYILGSISQGTQSFLACSEFSSVASKIASLHPATKMFATPLAYLLYLPGCALICLNIVPAALYRNAKFTEIANFANKFLPKNWQINPIVTDAQKKAYVFISNYSGDTAQVVMAVSTVAMFILGAKTEAIATLTVMGIGYLDRKGLLNERVSFFLNENLSTITNIASIILGSPLQKMLGVINIVTSSDFIMKKISYYIEDRIKPTYEAKGVHYPTLRSMEEKIEAKTGGKFKADEILSFDSVVTPDMIDKMDDKSFSRFFKKIEKDPKFTSFISNEGKVLYRDFENAFEKLPYNAAMREFGPDSFKIDLVGKALWKKVIVAFGQQHPENFKMPLEIDPSHVQRTIKMDLTSDAKFETLNDLFVKIGFEGKALDRLIAKIEEDDRFQKEYLIADNNQWLRDLQKLKDQPQEKKQWDDALLAYGKNQLATYVKALTGEQLPVGVNSGIDDVRKSSKFLIKHLENLHNKIEDTNRSVADRNSAKIEAQSILSTLLIQGGGYCFDGVVVAVDVCVNKVLANGYGLSGLQAHLDFMAQEVRTQSFEQMYALVMNPNYNPLANLLGGNDVHMVNLAKRLFSRGIGLDRSAAVADGGSTKYPLVELFFATSLPVIRALVWNNDINRASMTNDFIHLQDLVEKNGDEISQIYKTTPFNRAEFIKTYAEEIENSYRNCQTGEVTIEIEIKSKDNAPSKIKEKMPRSGLSTHLHNLSERLSNTVQSVNGPVELTISIVNKAYAGGFYSSSCFSESYDKSASNWKAVRSAKKTVKIVPKAFESIGNACLLGTLFGSVAFNEMASFPYNENELITRAKKRIEDSKSGQGVAGLREQYTTWWTDYIAKLAAGDADKEYDLGEKILYGPEGHLLPSIRKFHEKVLNKTTGQYEIKEIFEDCVLVNEKYLKIMLIEMGFLKKP